MSEERKFEDCEHEKYTVCNTEPGWIDAYCDFCGARLLFNQEGVEPPDD